MYHGNLIGVQLLWMHFQWYGTRNPFVHFHLFPLFIGVYRRSADKAEGVIIVPMWPNQTYYPRLMLMLIQLQDCYRGRRTCLDYPTHTKVNCFERKCS